MNFDLTEDQEMMRDMFARFLDEHSSMARVRAAAPSGFDAELWKGLAELGALSIRVPEEAGGLGLGLLDAIVLMEEAGRTLASGPIAEAILAARLLGQLQTKNVIEGSSATYNIPSAYHLRGKLDVTALEAAFQTLLARHEILRTRFESIQGEGPYTGVKQVFIRFFIRSWT